MRGVGWWLSGWALTATAFACVTRVHGQESEATNNPAPIEIPRPSTVIAGDYNPARSFAPMVKAVEPAVVAIEVEGNASATTFAELPPMFRDFLGVDPKSFTPEPRNGEGSGFLVSADGLVLTNHHVIDGADQIRARFTDGREVIARVLGSDESLDVAVLQLDGDEPWPFVPLGTSKSLEVGDWVVAVGNPLGLGTTVTAGIVSGKGRALGHGVYDDFLQTDAAINQGNSGGPLFNLDGQVVGMNTAIIAGANTVGFAIPIDLVKDAMEELRSNGHISRGYIGIRPDASRSPDQPGALVGQVYDDTPAKKAGLHEGDRIVSVDGKDIKGPAELVRTIGARDPGDPVRLAVVRDGEKMEVALVLAERPDEPMTRPPQPTPPKPRPKQDSGPAPSAQGGGLGIELRDLPEEKAHAFSLRTGVEVADVKKGSSFKGYVEPGDVILEVNHWPVSSSQEVGTIIKESQGSALLLVLRDGTRRFVVVPLP